MLFDSTNYRLILRGAAARLKKEHPARTLKWIATKTGIQAPYLTNVLKERAHLNSDQLYAITQLLDWDEDQIEYVFLLLEWERSSHPKRRQELRAKVDQIRKEKLRSRAHIKQQEIDRPPDSLTRIFLHPYYYLLYTFMAVPRFAQKPSRIARCLNLGTKQISELIKELVELKLLVRSDNGYAATDFNFHLPKESPLCEPHQTLMNQLGSFQMQSLPTNEKFTFMATLTADPETRERIQREYMNFLKTIEPLVKEAKAEEVYGLRFDLFRWSHEKTSDE